MASYEKVIPWDALNLSAQENKLGIYYLQGSCVIAIKYVELFIETHQSYTPGRHNSRLDLVISKAESVQLKESHKEAEAEARQHRFEVA